jgi:hypothetical protein
MRFSLDNFLYGIKQIVTGVNKTVNTTGTANAADGGIKRDVFFPPNEITNSAATFPAITNNTAGTATTTWAALTGTYATDVAEFRNILSQIALQLNALNLSNGTTDTGAIPTFVVASGTNPTVGIVSFIVPRDYDEASDNFKLRIPIYLANADSTITLTGTPTTQPNGGTATTGTLVSATLPFSTATVDLSKTLQVVELNLSGLGLVRDETIAVALAIAGTTTGNTYILGYDVHYDSTIVSYNESDTTGTDGTLAQDGNPLR